MLAPMTTDRVWYEAFREALEASKPGWRLTDQGLLGPAGATVRLAQRHPASSEGHVDVGFALGASSATPTVLWDCVAGFGATVEARARTAAQLWGQTTAGALLELACSQQGEFADHYRGDEEGGFPGWHIISGAVLGYGAGDSPGVLQQWWLEHPVLPAVAAALGGSLDERPGPRGIKLLLGGPGVAEVRLDGEVHEAASDALAALPWPRREPPGFVRSYVVALHREGGG